MTNPRRQYLKAAGALGAMAFLPGIPQAMAQESKLKASADAILKAATDAGDVPGVVAMATNRSRQGKHQEAIEAVRKAGITAGQRVLVTGAGGAVVTGAGAGCLAVVTGAGAGAGARAHAGVSGDRGFFCG